MKALIGAITGVITGIIGIITGNVWLIISSITQIAGAVAYQFNQDIGTALMFIGGAVGIIGIPIVRKIAASVMQFIRGVGSWLNEILQSIGYYINLGIEFVGNIINDFNAYFNNLITSTLAPVFNKIREYAETLSSIFSIAQTVGYLSKGDYLKAFYNLIQWVDAKVAVNLENSLKYVDDAVKSLLSTFTKTLGLTEKKLKRLASDLLNTSDVVKMIGEAFGVKEIVELSEGIKQFREEVVKAAALELKEFRKEIDGAVKTITSPLYEGIKHFRAVRRDNRRYNRFFTAFIFSGLSDKTVWVHPPEKMIRLKYIEPIF